MRALLLVVAFLLPLPGRADVPPRKPMPEQCRADGDCVMSAFDGCCGACCPSAPRAWLRAELARREDQCAVVDCERPGPCGGPCAPIDEAPQVAACVLGRCVAQRAPPPPDPDFCSSDSECVASTFAGCCGTCCPVQPVAVSRRRDALQRQQCAAVRCARPDCSRIACAQVMPSPIVPVCRGNRCVADRPQLVPPPPPPPAQCRADEDCGVDLNPPPGSACWSSACGCCPSPRAVPVEQVRPPPVRRSPSTGQGTSFGLSQGSTQASPTCGPCPATAPQQAACAGGRCVLRGAVLR